MRDSLPPGLRRFWQILWALAVALTLVSLFATLSAKPYANEVLRHFPAEMLEIGRDFTQEVHTAAVAESLAALAALLWLCFSERGTLLLQRLEQLGGSGRGRGVLNVAAGITVILALVELPFAYYLGFWHEQAYGLSHGSDLAWLTGYFSTTGLHLIMALALWLPVYWVMPRWPRFWWMPGALVSTGFTGLLIVLAPSVLLPLTGQVVPVRDPQVVAMAQGLAERAGVHVVRVVELVVSGHSTRLNAMVTGLGDSKQIVLYDTLLQRLRPQEVEVVLAHELAHAAHSDVVVRWALSAAADFGFLCLSAWMLTRMVEAGALKLPAAHAPRGLALVLLLSTLFSDVTAPIDNYFSRQMEIRADRFAITLTGNPDAFISGFRKLARGNPGDVDPPALVEFLDHSHPSIMNRIRAAEAQGRTPDTDPQAAPAAPR